VMRRACSINGDGIGCLSARLPARRSVQPPMPREATERKPEGSAKKKQLSALHHATFKKGFHHCITNGLLTTAHTHTTVQAAHPLSLAFPRSPASLVASAGLLRPLSACSWTSRRRPAQGGGGALNLPVARIAEVSGQSPADHATRSAAPLPPLSVRGASGPLPFLRSPGKLQQKTRREEAEQSSAAEQSRARERESRGRGQSGSPCAVRLPSARSWGRLYAHPSACCSAHPASDKPDSSSSSSSSGAEERTRHQGHRDTQDTSTEVRDRARRYFGVRS
jgi:hypothetical protein